jgi:hypothetical protein
LWHFYLCRLRPVAVQLVTLGLSLYLEIMSIKKPTPKPATKSAAKPAANATAKPVAKPVAKPMAKPAQTAAPAQTSPSPAAFTAKAATSTPLVTPGAVAVVAWAYLWRSWLAAVLFSLAWQIVAPHAFQALPLSPQAGNILFLSLQLTLSLALQVYVFQWMLTDGIKGKGWQLAATFTQPASALNWLKVWFSFTWRSLVWVMGGAVLVFLGFLGYLFFVAQTPESGALYVQAMFAFNPIYGLSLQVAYVLYTSAVAAVVWRTLLRKKTFGWGTLALAKLAPGK